MIYTRHGRLFKVCNVIFLVSTFMMWMNMLLYMQARFDITETDPELEIQDFDSWNRWDNITGSPRLIVPNWVHFFKLRNHELKFSEMVVLLSAWCHQWPERIIIHCDCDDLTGPYWEKVKDLEGIEVHRTELPTEVYGQPLSEEFRFFHAGDIERINVLQKYGGIALDFDTFVVRNLDEFRHFECTIGWPPGANIGCQVIITHKKARFLQLYKESYHSYDPNSWYFNAGQLPTRILERLPHLIHAVPWQFGVRILRYELYNTSWPDWRFHHTIHLLMSRRNFTMSPKEFDEYNIRNYTQTFGEMARLMVYGSTNLIHHNEKIEYDYTSCRRNRKNSDKVSYK